MELTINGRIRDRKATVTWTPAGGLDGDPDVIVRAGALVRFGAKVSVPALTLRTRASLSPSAEDEVVFATLLRAFDEVYDWQGFDWPELPEDARA